MSEDTKILKQIAASLARIEIRLGVEPEIRKPMTAEQLLEWRALGREFSRIMGPVLATSSGPPPGGGTMTAQEFFDGRGE